MEGIGQRIRLARKKAKLTQGELGELLGRVKATVSLWENDQSYPELHVLAALCVALKVSADYIIRGVDTEFLDADAIEYARRIAAIPKEQRTAFAMIFGPAVSDEHVAKHLPSAPGRQPK